MSHEELKRKLEPAAAHMTENQVKDVMKEAITEWMDDKFKQFGKWTLTGFAVAAVAALTYFILRMNGWELTHK